MPFVEPAYRCNPLFLLWLKFAAAFIAHLVPISSFQHYFAFIDIGVISFAHPGAAAVNRNATFLFHFTYCTLPLALTFFKFSLRQVPFFVTVNKEIFPFRIDYHSASCIY